jgi:hypothetical protein
VALLLKGPAALPYLVAPGVYFVVDELGRRRVARVGVVLAAAALGALVFWGSVRVAAIQAVSGGPAGQFRESAGFYLASLFELDPLHVVAGFLGAALAFRTAAGRRREALLLASWGLVPLLVFSVLEIKLVHYAAGIPAGLVLACGALPFRALAAQAPRAIWALPAGLAVAVVSVQLPYLVGHTTLTDSSGDLRTLAVAARAASRPEARLLVRDAYFLAVDYHADRVTFMAVPPPGFDKVDAITEFHAAGRILPWGVAELTGALRSTTPTLVLAGKVTCRTLVRDAPGAFVIAETEGLCVLGNPAARP